ncbi:DUF5050 domain-containing protein [Tissierella sp.]|uniref:DUF5050 domain-containing protein n=1 Tax=Tissierella sp. TaxID=41274 RepID=UPI002862DD1C|nr:DUF5050 domain-containing protein [Tissierella sp.]MDR7857684.1 DUF5050 domain-containing protein [Tissierella sp.]
MQENFRHKLKGLIENNLIDIIGNYSKFNEILKSLQNEYKKESFIILSSYEENIHQEIILAKGIENNTLLFQRLINVLQDNMGFSKETSEWVVETWFYILNVNMSGDQYKDNINSNEVANPFTLIKDVFETEEEYITRIIESNPLEIGTAVFNIKGYDIETGRFPISIDMSIKTEGMRIFSSDGYIIVNRDIARSIYVSEDPILAYLKFGFDKFGIYADKVELRWRNYAIPVSNIKVELVIEGGKNWSNILADSNGLLNTDIGYPRYHNKLEYNGWNIFTHSTGPEVLCRTIHEKKTSEYFNIYKSRINGNEVYKLNSYESGIIAVNNGIINYINKNFHGRLFTVDINGENQGAISNGRIRNYAVDKSGRYIYYVEHENLNDTWPQNLYRVSYDGNTKEFLFSKHKDISILQIKDNFLYYSVGKEFYIMNLSTKQILQSITFPNVILEKKPGAIFLDIKCDSNYKSFYFTYSDWGIIDNTYGTIPRFIHRVNVL